MEIKVRVKSLKIESFDDGDRYYASFEPLDKTIVCNEKIFFGITDNKNITKVQETHLLDIEVKESLFNFISIHSKEYFILTLEENYKIIGVSLIYG